MQFAIAMTLVVLISTAFLLYQFWTGVLAPDDAETASSLRAEAAETAPRSRPVHLDTAA